MCSECMVRLRTVIRDAGSKFNLFPRDWRANSRRNLLSHPVMQDAVVTISALVLRFRELQQLKLQKRT